MAIVTVMLVILRIAFTAALMLLRIALSAFMFIVGMVRSTMGGRRK